MKSMKSRVQSCRTPLMLTVILLLVGVLAISASSPAYAKSKKKKKKTKYTYEVTLAHAKNDEKGRFSWASYGAKPGDQRGNEVAMDSYYSYSGWTYVARPKSAAAAKIIAKQAIKGCKNNKIGYGKDGLQLYDEAEKVGFQLNKIKVKVHTDCYQFIHTCCAAAGITASPIYLTLEMDYEEWYEDDDGPPQFSDQVFTIYRDKAHRKQAKMLKVGDILVRQGKKQHAAIVCKIKKKKVK